MKVALRFGVYYLVGFVVVGVLLTLGISFVLGEWWHPFDGSPDNELARFLWLALGFMALPFAVRIGD